MTDITDAETAEVLWASSEQGKAAVMAACRKADELGLTRTAGRPVVVIEPADIGAIVYAAYLAIGWDGEPAESMEDGKAVPAHLHIWTILGAQPHIPFVVIGKPAPHTIMLIRCSECGEPDARMLTGEWTLEDLQRQQRLPPPSRRLARLVPVLLLEPHVRHPLGELGGRHAVEQFGDGAAESDR